MSHAFATSSPLHAAGHTRAQLRQALKHTRERLEHRTQRESALAEALGRELRELSARCIGAYCASRGEFDALRALVDIAGERGWPWKVALPVVQPSSRGMRFHAWRPGQALRSGAYGIAEPEPDEPAVEPDLLLVPCLGFGPDGLRLGYGGGYYDRYLEHRAAVRTIGLAFEACRVEGLRAEAHDRPLDVILTESARYARCARGDRGGATTP
ncbi:MAG: 5-formyltetrahydrofolate cyclo-ligase [Betaproteobacteria bacterium]|nr:5-formyltetrahydrofolate cyclo-ligase [Betaproteobacteria bacterium]